MANPTIDLKTLSSRRVAPMNGTQTIHPPRRWMSRLVLPLLLLGGFGGLVVWASWDYLLPATPVSVTSVAVRKDFVDTGGTELLKGVGWVEPNPSPLEVGAFTEGIVEELPVRLGQRLNKGDIVARLNSVEAQSKLATANAELAEQHLRVKTADADIAEAAAQRTVAEAHERAEFKLWQDKIISESRYQLAKAQLVVAQAKIDQAKARKEEAEGRLKTLAILRDKAQRRLDYTTVRTPFEGVVMKLHTAPGRMVGLKSVSAEHFESLIELYDPRNLQIRVEVPLDKFRHIRPLQPAWVEVDTLPGKRLPGVVLYDTHQTDITRNTVQVKVGLVRFTEESLAPIMALPWSDSIHSGLFGGLCAAAGESQKPQDVLRPGMIASVRIYSPQEEVKPKTDSGETLRLFIPRKLIVQEEGRTSVWIVDQSAKRAVKRKITVGRETGDEWIEVTEGLQASDKLITTGRDSLKANERVKITGEETQNAPK